MTAQPYDQATRQSAPAQIKRIVICCDGTWQRLDAQDPTNPVRVAKAVLPNDPCTGTVQLVHHLDGVGTGRGTGAVARWTDRIFGGLMGSGLTETVAEAYRHLVFSYNPGDEIYLFGYSRGAYTARSIAGLIRNCGILSRENCGKVGEALTLYRSRRPEDAPDGEAALAFRADNAPTVLTGQGEREWRRKNRPGRNWDAAVPLRIAYIGVWDTVGSLGVPDGLLLSEAVNRRHRFHDTSLSSRVRAARHAVAIDERRRNFQPTLWRNTDRLNAGAADAQDEAPYRQQWFPGVHSAVGGGGSDVSLSSMSLLWVIEGAERLGLAFDAAALAAMREEADVLGPLGGSVQPVKSLLTKLLHAAPRDREGPATLPEVAEPARQRWNLDPAYRPRSLRGLEEQLDGQGTSASVIAA